MFYTLLMCVVMCANAKRQYHVKEAQMQDQISASSGYVYNSHSGPVSYSYFSNGVGGGNFHYPYGVYYQPYNHLPQLHGSEGHKGFVVNKGDNYDGSHYEKNGREDQKGYTSEEEFDKGSKGAYDKENHKGHYNKEGSDKKGHYESSEHYSKGDEAAKSSNGGSYNESSGHKKGSKTTGYHKVYKKDEYKKDKTFYDESDKRGHYNKYANADSYHKGESGALEKGGRSDVGFQETAQGENGDYDKGHYDVRDSKFSDQQGKEEHRENYSGYAEDSNKNIGELYGFKED